MGRPEHYELTLDKLFVSSLVSSPEKEIVYRDVRRYNYVTFYERVRRLASGLMSLGLRDGSKVGVIDWNTNHFLELMFAVPLSGSILHTINLRLAPQEILYTINYVRDDAFVIRDEFVPLAEKLAPAMPFVKQWIVTSDDGSLPSTTLRPVAHIEDVIKGGDPNFEFPKLSENATAAVYFTSGTTGLPKAVYFSHRQITLQSIINGLVVTAYPSPVRVSSADVIMHIPPFFHGLGWMMPYLATLLGMKQVLPGKPDAKVMLELIKREKVTFGAGVPIFLKMLIEHPEAENYRDALSNFKYLLDGEHPPRSLFYEAKKFGVQFIEAFGMSEGVGYTFAVPKEYMLDWPWEKLLDYINTAGLPGPFVQVKIVDESGKPVPKDFKTMGKVLVKSPGLTEGYWKDPERTEASWTDDGWFITGDIGVWNEEGYILIVDREKDVIKSGGEWISSVRLEDMIASHPAVARAAVVGVRSRKWSERPVALIVLKPEYKGRVREEDIREYLLKEFVETGKIPKWWLPDKIMFVDDLPLTSVGKINKRALREQLKELELP